jgi:hypothetical protein
MTSGGNTTDIGIAINVDDKRLVSLQKKLLRTKKLIIDMEKSGFKGTAAKLQARELQRQIQVRKFNIRLQKQQLELQRQQAMAASKTIGFINRGQKAQLGFNGAALSGMFFGMALQKAFGGAIKSIFEGYKKVIPEGHKFNKMTTQLSANWEFFKFQLADALANSPLFAKFIQFLINILKVVQATSAEFKLMVVSILAIGAAIGTWLFAVNTLKLGMAGIVDGMQLLNAETGKFQWGQLGKYGKIAAAAGVVVLAYEGMQLLHEHSATAKKKWEGLQDAGLKLLQSIFEPMGIEIKNLRESLIIFGAVAQNIIGVVIASFGALVATLRIVYNTIQIVVESMISLVEAWQAFKRGDLSAAVTSFKELKRNATTNLKDIQDAFLRTGEISNDVMNNWVTGSDVADAITNMRSEINRGIMVADAGGTQGGATTVNQVYIEGAFQSVGTETQETADKFIGALTGDVLGSTNGFN